MVIRIDSTPARMTAWIPGEVDHHAAAVIRDQVDQAVNTARPPVLRLDFSGVTFMDSSGIGLIMGRYRLVQGYGGTLEIAGASERLRRLMGMAGLDRLPVRWVTPSDAEEKPPAAAPARRR